MDSPRTPRFSVLNNDRDHIYISKTLLNKLSNQAVSSSKQDSPGSNVDDTESTGKVPPVNQQSSPISSNQSSFPDFSFGGGSKSDSNMTSMSMADNAHTIPASIDPEYIAKHAQFDSSAHLYALRGEYERKLQQYQQIWRARFDELEHLNEQLFHLNSEKFSNEVSKVNERYFRSHQTYDIPCRPAESFVIQCLVENPKKPLLCSDEVKKFTACVEKTRIDTLKN